MVKSLFYQLFIFFSLLFPLIGMSIDISLGEAFSINQDLKIHRDDLDDIDFNASFKTNGLKSPHYYSIRLRKEIAEKNLEFEFIHHKLYVYDNLPNEIEKFEITDGFNLLLVNLHKMINESMGFRIGIGTVVTHPDIIIDGKTNYIEGGGLIPKFWTDGYHWGGVSSQLSVFLNKRLNDKLYYNIEGKAVVANANIPIADGKFDLPNISLHILLGISFLV
tara:strand:- start:1009 stop:1668 length:660 start_codon:yes stop_codon:yes gene_type:complete